MKGNEWSLEVVFSSLLSVVESGDISELHMGW
jgi:hypothetical protein